MVRMRWFYSIPLVLAACLFLAGCGGNGNPEGTSGETAFQYGKSVTAEKSAKMLTVRLAVNDTYCKKTACQCIQYLASREYEDLTASLLSA